MYRFVYILHNLQRFFKIQGFEGTSPILQDIMAATAQNISDEEVSVLRERLAKAERRLNLLHREIDDIKTKITRIESSTSTRPFSTSTKRFASESDNEGVTKLLNAAASLVDNNIIDSSLVDSGTKKRCLDQMIQHGEYVVVYTDGSCENNGKYNAKAGIGVWFGENHPLNVSQPVKGKATNNAGEIQACTAAVNIAVEHSIKKLIIRTDSQFVINSMTKWIQNWKRKNWKLATGGDVKNKGDFSKLDQACKLLEHVMWEYVPGHQGNRGNEEADKLARAGAMVYK